MCILVNKWEKQTITFEGSPPKSDLIEIKPTHYERMETQIAQKGAALGFMKKAEVVAVAPMFYKDRETGK